MSDFEIVIASITDREELIAELYYKGNQWVEISHETDEMLIQYVKHRIENNFSKHAQNGSLQQFHYGQNLEALAGQHKPL